jgi:hypothetical protein
MRSQVVHDETTMAENQDSDRKIRLGKTVPEKASTIIKERRLFGYK